MFTCTGVFVTTDKVYEDDLGIPFLETDKLGSKDPYSASSCDEILINSYRNSFLEFSPVLLQERMLLEVVIGRK